MWYFIIIVYVCVCVCVLTCVCSINDIIVCVGMTGGLVLLGLLNKIVCILIIVYVCVSLHVYVLLCV